MYYALGINSAFDPSPFFGVEGKISELNSCEMWSLNSPKERSKLGTEKIHQPYKHIYIDPSICLKLELEEAFSHAHSNHRLSAEAANKDFNL